MLEVSLNAIFFLWRIKLAVIKVHRTVVYRLVRAVHTGLIGDRYGRYIGTPLYTMCQYAWYSSVQLDTYHIDI